jgi:hypothetical protein
MKGWGFRVGFNLQVRDVDSRGGLDFCQALRVDRLPAPSESTRRGQLQCCSRRRCCAPRDEDFISVWVLCVCVRACMCVRGCARPRVTPKAGCRGLRAGKRRADLSRLHARRVWGGLSRRCVQVEFCARDALCLLHRRELEVRAP